MKINKFWSKKWDKIRTAILWILGIIGINSYFGFIKTKMIYQGSFKNFCVPVLNCHSCPGARFACPVGMIQFYMDSVKQIPYFIIGFLSIIGLTIGRMPCGLICPFGYFQELLYKIKIPKKQMSESLKAIKYLVLIFLVIIIPFLSNHPWFCRLCPAGTLTAGLPWALWNPVSIDPFGFESKMIDLETVSFIFYLKIIILAVLIYWAIIVKRPFCRVLCPLGAFLGIFNKVSIFQLKVNKNCNNCGYCKTMCPMDIAINENSTNVDCIRCLKCLRCDNVKIESLYNSSKIKKEEIEYKNAEQ